jgi:glycosyltransferase involved in cell wall biosynthesis
MRILYLTTGLALGGAERQLALMSGIMARRGHEVRIVSMTDTPPSGGVAIDPRVAVESLGMKCGHACAGDVLNLARLVRRWRPDVVHSHMIHANMMACACRLVCRIRRLVCTAHSDIETENTVMLVAYKAASRICDVFTHVSEPAADIFRTAGIHGPHGILTVSNGIEWSRFNAVGEADRQAVRAELGIPDDAYIFIYLGRFELVKGVDLLAEAFERIRAEGSLSRLIMVGQGSLGPDLRRRYTDTGFSWIGSTVRPEKWLSAADCLVAPSRNEGFGLSIAEAMAAGLEVIASDCAGPLEILQGGRFGHIFPRGDSGALARLMRERELEGRLPHPEYQEYSRERFDAERIADVWLELYGATRGRT